MNTYQTLLLAAIATASIAGCAGTPAWEKPKPRPRLAEEKPVEPKKTPNETTKKYERVALEVIYKTEDKTTAALLRGYATLTGMHQVEAAFEADKDKDGIVSYAELSDLIEQNRKKHGGEVKLTPQQGGTVLSYVKTVYLPQKRASEMENEYSNSNVYEKMQMLKNWENTYGQK